MVCVKGLGSPRRNPDVVAAAGTMLVTAVPWVWFISAHLWYGCIEADLMFVFMPLGIFPGERQKKKKKQCKISCLRGHFPRSMQDSQQPCLGFPCSTPGTTPGLPATASSSFWPSTIKLFCKLAPFSVEKSWQFLCPPAVPSNSVLVPS